MDMENEYDLNKKLISNIREALKLRREVIQEITLSAFKSDADDNYLNLMHTNEKPDSDTTIDKTVAGAVEVTPEESSKKSIDIDPIDLKDEQAKLNEIVGATAKITFFKVYPENGYAIMTGTISDLDNLEFQLTTQSSDGIYITSADLQLTDTNMKVLHKFTGYYASWKEMWTLKVNNEYNKKD
jgi:hypothetical protein